MTFRTILLLALFLIAAVVVIWRLDWFSNPSGSPEQRRTAIQNWQRLASPNTVLGRGVPPGDPVEIGPELAAYRLAVAQSSFPLPLDDQGYLVDPDSSERARLLVREQYDQERDQTVKVVVMVFPGPDGDFETDDDWGFASTHAEPNNPDPSDLPEEEP